MKHKSYREQKLELMAKNPYCHWCGRLTKDYGDLTKKHHPKDMATVDHLKSRYFRKKGEVSERVLACNECNAKRSHEENLVYGPVYIGQEL